MSCELPGEDPVAQEVFVTRGDVATVDWGTACEAMGGPDPVKCRGEIATLVGTPGNDRGDEKLIGTPGVDVVVAGKGGDFVKAAGGDDLVCGGSGDDTLKGGSGNDTLRGGPGKDRCPGASGGEVKSCRPS
jgi:Ca2+-binding RTX toxin-like protein